MSRTASSAPPTSTTCNHGFMAADRTGFFLSEFLLPSSGANPRETRHARIARAPAHQPNVRAAARLCETRLQDRGLRARGGRPRQGEARPAVRGLLPGWAG